MPDAPSLAAARPGAAADPSGRPPSAPPRRRYAVVGTGHRAEMYVDALRGPHADVGEIVAWCEPNPVRAAYYDAFLGTALPTYAPADLERMVTDERVDAVVVTSPDRTHADVVGRAMRAGADVVLEKPMTTSVEGCHDLLAAVRDTGRDLVLTFNYRYSPRNSTLKQVVASGEIGQVTAVHFEWVLDTMHGADYFRRWHRDKATSGGLLVHKASHHFDLVNWWLADDPVSVVARGGLRFYGEAGAGATTAERDPFTLDLADDPRLEALYGEAARHDGYRRDQDVFAPGVSIEDTMSVLVEYSRGALLTYSLTAYGPWEGYRVSVTGTRGRAELEVVERAAVLVGDEGRLVLDPSAVEDTSADPVRRRGERLVVQRHWEPAREVEIPRGEGAHGGGDAMLLTDLFRGASDDPLGRPAGLRDGVLSTAVGLAANRSLASGETVRIADLGLRVGERA